MKTAKIVGLVVLVELAIILGVLALNLFTGFIDGGLLWERAWQAEYNQKQCSDKHRILLDHIKKEGLWNRLGMPGQPYLQ